LLNRNQFGNRHSQAVFISINRFGTLIRFYSQNDPWSSKSMVDLATAYHHKFLHITGSLRASRGWNQAISALQLKGLVSEGNGYWAALGKAERPGCVLKDYGKGDSRKRVCSAGLEVKNCIVISVGCNNKWEFEKDICEKHPNCRIETLDCTGSVQVPPALVSRVTLHSICVGNFNHANHLTYPSVLHRLNMTSGPSHLKLDAEGAEYKILESIVGMTEDLRPDQISVELHYKGDVSVQNFPIVTADEISHVVPMMSQGGYAFIAQDDNPIGSEKPQFCCATELVFVKRQKVKGWL
jgi:hypothetical protein